MGKKWDTSLDDVAHVLGIHGIHDAKQVNKAYEKVDCDEVHCITERYNDFDKKCEVAYSSIEDQLMEAGILNGVKKFN